MSLRTVALESLKTKFEGIDEKVLSRIAKNIAKTAKDEDEVKTSVEELTLQGVIDAYTDSRVTEGSEKAVKTYEEKHGLKDGKAVKKEDDDDDNTKPNKNGEEDDKDTPAYAKALMESVKALAGEVASLKADNTANSRQSVVDKLLENAPDGMKTQLLREFKRANFKDDEDFNSWIEEITPDVEEARETHQAQQTSGGKPKGGGGGQSGVISSGVQARIDARKAETATPAIKGLPQN